MLFKGTVIGQASGKMAGIVASHNAGGQYFRQNATPTNPNTATQQLVRMYFTAATLAWRDTLTAQQRQDWAAYAQTVSAVNRVGDPIELTGQQVFVRNNSLVQLAGEALQAAAPTEAGDIDLGLISAAQISTGAGSFAAALGGAPAWAADDDGRLLTFGSAGQSAGKTFWRRFRYNETIDGSTSTPLTAIVGTQWPFPVVAGLRYWVRYIAVLNGRISAPQIFDAVAT